MEDKGEEKDKGEGGGFAHGKEGKRNEFQGHVPQPNIEGGGRATWDEASEIEEFGHDRTRFGRAIFDHRHRRAKEWKEIENGGRQQKLDEHVEASRKERKREDGIVF